MIGREGLHREVVLDLFREAGAIEPRNHLATGNVSFSVDPERLDALVAAVESDLQALLGRPTPLFVRTLDDLVALLEADHFVDAPFDDVAARLVTFFRDRVPHTLDLPLHAPNGDWSVFAVGPGEVFSVTRARIDRQPQDPGGVIQRIAGEPVTTRALGTLDRIVAKLTG